MKIKESLNAKAVAKEVIDKVSKGEKINLQEIQKNHGYAKTSARSMKATTTQTFKKEVEPFVEKLKRERELALKAITNEKRGSAGYRDLVSATDTLTKNIQLLEGKPTDITKQIDITQEEIDDYKRARKLRENKKS